jgi:hypothetical protein
MVHAHVNSLKGDTPTICLLLLWYLDHVRVMAVKRAIIREWPRTTTLGFLAPACPRASGVTWSSFRYLSLPKHNEHRNHLVAEIHFTMGVVIWV